MGRTELRTGLALLALAAAGAAHAEDADRIEALEQRVAELEADADAGSAPAFAPGALAEWAERVRLGGSASVGYFHRDDQSPQDSDAFQVWDARLFVDAELARDVEVAGATVVRTIGASIEWDLVRLGELENQVGELYVDFQGIGGSPWLSAQVGRFQIPLGENYLRFSRGYRDNPFVSNTVGGPWWWDEGVRLYGASRDGRFGYVASVSAGDTRFNTDANDDPQGTLKLFAAPCPWFHVSVSGLLSGAIGHGDSGAPGALWLGETWAMPFGAFTAVPNFIDGVAAPDGPTRISDTWLLGADTVLTPLDGLRLWLAGGRYRINTSGAGPYERTLDYWIAELVAEGRLVSPALDPLYLALRANGLTTGDSGRGYLLDTRLRDTLGFNMHRLREYSVALGVRIGEWVRIRSEFVHREIALVRGVTPAIARQGDDEHWFAVDVGIAF